MKYKLEISKVFYHHETRLDLLTEKEKWNCFIIEADSFEIKMETPKSSFIESIVFIKNDECEEEIPIIGSYNLYEEKENSWNLISKK